jgi:hypothetical protein
MRPLEPIKAWAILRNGKMYKFVFSFKGHRHMETFPTKRDAKEWLEGDYKFHIDREHTTETKIIPVEIRPIKK